MTSFGYDLGLAFQVHDDILDLTGDQLKLGKPVQSDLQQEKVTYPSILGVTASSELVAKLTETALESLSKAQLPNPSRLLQMANYLLERDY